MNIRWIILAIITVLVISGCGPAQDRTTTVREPVIVTDATGATVTIPEQPSRIVPVGVSTEDIVLSLIAPERVVALGQFPNNVPDRSKGIAHHIRFTTEAMLDVQPDLVIAPDWVALEQVEEMRNINIPVYVYTTPETVEEAKETISHIANLLNASDAALQESMATDLARVESIVQAHNQGPSPVVVLYTRFGINGGTGSTFDNMSHYMKVTNGAATIGLGPIDNGTREDLIRINPDVIIIPSDDYSNEQDAEVNINELLLDPALQGIKAIQNHRIYTVKASWLMSYSQFMTKGILDMVQQIYP